MALLGLFRSLVNSKLQFIIINHNTIINTNNLILHYHRNCKFMAYIIIYHGFISRIKYVVACNVKIVKSEYSCTIVQNKYNINKNIEQYNTNDFNKKKIYFFIHLNKFYP